MEQITLKRNDSPRKNSRIAVFELEGRRTSVSIPKSVFPNGEVPETLTLQTEGTYAPVAQPKPKETKEERKARLANLPKLTLEEKIQRRKDAIAKMEEKLVKQRAADAAAAGQ